jgi:F-type H+-transporting ATPase subunit b
MEIFYNSNFVFALALAIFFATIVYYGVHRLIFKALDERAKRIRGELDEARRLREEAQKTFADFERKSREVGAQADEIVEHARAEAERAGEKAKVDIQASIERRLKGADEQIAMAERDAVREVKDRAVRVAVAAAAQVMRERITAQKANALIEQSIETVGKRLN